MSSSFAASCAPYVHRRHLRVSRFPFPLPWERISWGATTEWSIRTSAGRTAILRVTQDSCASCKKTDPICPIIEIPADQVTFRDVARSLAAFIRSEFRLEDTAFHRFVFGQHELTSTQLKGGLVFYGKGKCINCHMGPHFSDFRFHAVPLPQLGFGKNGFGIDYGRFNVTFHPQDLYRFRTPPLLNVAETAPYGHAGASATLQDAVTAHFDPLGLLELRSMDALARHELFRRMAAVGDEFKLVSHLNEAEVDQVAEFLNSLSFEPRSTR